MNTAAAKEFLRKNDIRFVLAQFVDIHGAAKAKAVPVEHLDMVLTDGAGFAGFALWGFGMGPHGPDYMAIAYRSGWVGRLHSATTTGSRRKSDRTRFDNDVGRHCPAVRR